MAQKEEQGTAVKLEGRFARFFGTHTTLLIVIGIAVVVVVAGLWIGLSVSERNALENQRAIDELQVSYSEWAALEDKSTPEAQAAMEELVTKLSDLAGKRAKSYATIKAQYLLGLVSYTNGEYAEARTHFEQAAKKGEGTYLASLSYYNAAVASEQLQDTAKALEYYQIVYDRYGDESAEAPKALFSIARLYEAENELRLARAVFQQLADEYPASEYAKLAKSRLLFLPE